METRRTVRVALLVAVGLAIYVLEQSIPKPVPWLRFGLANSATLLALYLFGVKEAIFVAGMRAVLGSFLLGGVLNPAFLFSFFGGLISAACMAVVFSFFRKVFSVIGVSVWGALTHNLAQLAVAMLLFVHRIELLYLIPFFLLTAVVTGFLTGLLVFFLLRPLSQV